MSDPVQVALIAAVVGLVPSILAFLNGRQQSKNHEATTKDIGVLREQTDGKLEALADAVKGRAAAEGDLAGRAEVRQENKEDHSQ